MKVLSLLVLLFAQAHSQALLSGDPVAVNNQYSVDVTLSQCGPEPTQGDFVFGGATVSNFDCSGSDQSYTCSFGVSAPGSSFTVRHTLSNEISVEIQQSVPGVFSSAFVSGEDVVIIYDCGVPCSLGTGSFAVSTGEDVNDLIQIWSISVSEGNSVEIIVANSDLSTVYATAGAGAVVDTTNLGTNSEITTELNVAGTDNRAIGLQKPTCEYSDWGEWSGCNEKVECDTFDAKTFTIIASGFETRERTILSGSCNGDLEQTRSCPGAVSALCEGEVTYPRPGEHKGLCRGLPTGGEKCSATSPKSADNDFWETADCACDADCVERGDCCQAFFHRDCCTEGEDCADIHSDMVYDGKFPLECEAPPADDCFFTELKAEELDDATSSYYCSCTSDCVETNTCCGGSVERGDICFIA